MGGGNSVLAVTFTVGREGSRSGDSVVVTIDKGIAKENLMLDLPKNAAWALLTTSCICVTPVHGLADGKRVRSSISSLAGASESNPTLAENQIVGRWEWEFDLGPSKGTAKLEVGEKDKKLTAVLTAPDGSKIESKDFRLKGDKVSFSIHRKKGFFSVSVVHSGTLDGDTIRGAFVAKGGPIKKEGKWIARRVKTSPQPE